VIRQGGRVEALELAEVQLSYLAGKLYALGILIFNKTNRENITPVAK
jgi:hypothetical protein